MITQLTQLTYKRPNCTNSIALLYYYLILCPSTTRSMRNKTPALEPVFSVINIFLHSEKRGEKYFVQDYRE